MVTVIWLALAGLRHRRGRTAMCILGVVAGVALSVAVRVQTTSLTQGQEQTERLLLGRTTVEAVARGPAGMPVSTFDAVRRLPSVDAVAPISTQNVAIEGPRGRRVVVLVGVDRRLEEIGAPVGSTIGRDLDARDVGLYLPSDLAGALGIGPGDSVTILGPAGRRRTLLSHTLRRVHGQNVAAAPIALAPLGLAQTLTGQVGRVTRLLLHESTQTPDARHAIRAAVGPGVELRAPGWESALLAQATGLYRTAADLFAVLCLLLGATVVYAVTLLAAVDRRREVATLAALGCQPARLVGVLVCEAVMIGTVGGAAGTLLGWLLVDALGSSSADQVAFAFIISDHLRLGVGTASAGVLGGIAISIAATVAANARLVTEPPARALAAPTEALQPTKWSRLATAGGAAAFLVAGVIAFVVPELGVIAVCLVAGGAVLFVPGLLALLLAVTERTLPRPAGPGRLGISELRCAPTRSAAMAALVCVMVVGVIVVESVNRNLERSADRLANNNLFTTDLWATAIGNDPFLSRPMSLQARERLAAQPGVASVRSHRTVFTDWKGRRVLVLSLDTGRGPDHRISADVQEALSAGDLRLLDDGTAVLVSRDLARQHGVGLGDRVNIPTPSGSRELQIVGYVSNYGWQPGVIQMSSAVIGRWWREPSLSAVQIDLSDPADVTATRARLQALMAPFGVEIAPPARLRHQVRETTHAALLPLRKITLLFSLSGVLALVVSLIAAIMQRTRRIATLQAIGIRRRQALGSLMAEAAASTLAGAVAGVIGGLIAHRLALDYLGGINDTPVNYVVEPTAIALALAIAISAALVIPLLSLRWMSRVSIGNSFADV